MEKSQSKGAVMDLEQPQPEALPTSAKKFRVQLDFSQKDFDELNALADELDLSTRAELFRSALVALRWMVQKKRTGCTIAAITPEQRFFEPEFDFLQGFASAAPVTTNAGVMPPRSAAAAMSTMTHAKARTRG